MADVPLPHPVMNAMLGDDWGDLYTSDQMHAHAAAVSAAKDAEIEHLRERVRVLEDALLQVASMAEALKKDCGMDPESPQAVRNGQYMNISYSARAALAARKGTTPTTPPPSPSPRS